MRFDLPHDATSPRAVHGAADDDRDRRRGPRVGTRHPKSRWPDAIADWPDSCDYHEVDPGIGMHGASRRFGWRCVGSYTASIVATCLIRRQEAVSRGAVIAIVRGCSTTRDLTANRGTGHCLDCSTRVAPAARIRSTQRIEFTTAAMVPKKSLEQCLTQLLLVLFVVPLMRGSVAACGLRESAILVVTRIPTHRNDGAKISRRERRAILTRVRDTSGGLYLGRSL